MTQPQTTPDKLDEMAGRVLRQVYDIKTSYGAGEFPPTEKELAIKVAETDKQRAYAIHQALQQAYNQAIEDAAKELEANCYDGEYSATIVRQLKK